MSLASITPPHGLAGVGSPGAAVVPGTSARRGQLVSALCVGYISGVFGAARGGVLVADLL